MSTDGRKADGLRPEQKEILNGLLKRFSLMVRGVFWLRRLPVWVRRGLLWGLLGSFGGLGVGAGFWRSSLGGF
jgi:hypothetical protein